MRGSTICLMPGHGRHRKPSSSALFGKKLKKDVVSWCRLCDPCQTSKVARHVQALWEKRGPPDRHFGSLHVDLLGPLLECEGHKYLFTVVDRFSRWSNAIPLVDMTGRLCARALLRHWISRHGVPSDITCDRGRQFTSDLWKELNEILGISGVSNECYKSQTCTGVFIVPRDNI